MSGRARILSKNSDENLPKKISNKSSHTDASIDSKQFDVMNIQAIFPNAFRLYRLGLPNHEDLKYFETLETYL